MSRNFPNFRGHRALVLQPDDSHRKILLEQLANLGLVSTPVWPLPETLPDGGEVVFLDVDRRASMAIERDPKLEGQPLIAISGTEAPGQLEAMLALNPDAILNKPLRREAVFKALAFAYDNFKKRQSLTDSLTFQSEQIKARLLVVKVTLLVMRQLKLDEEDAYHLLRRASMSSNMVFEAFCFALLGEPARYMAILEREHGKLRAGRKNKKIVG